MCNIQFLEVKKDMVSIHQCILKPYLLVFHYRINFYWEFFRRKLNTTSYDGKLN